MLMSAAFTARSSTVRCGSGGRGHILDRRAGWGRMGCGWRLGDLNVSAGHELSLVSREQPQALVDEENAIFEWPRCDGQGAIDLSDGSRGGAGCGGSRRRTSSRASVTSRKPQRQAIEPSTARTRRSSVRHGSSLPVKQVPGVVEQLRYRFQCGRLAQQVSEPTTMSKRIARRRARISGIFRRSVKSQSRVTKLG